MLESAQPVVEDVDDPDEVSQCVSIDIPVEGSPDAASAAVHPEALVDLEGKMAALLAAHASETRKLEERVAQLEQLDLAVQITSAARDCASAAKAATELLSGATEAVRILRDDDQIESLIASHCENAAHAIRATVVSACEQSAAEVKRTLSERSVPQTTKRR